jgi:hypothetical protein
MPGWVWLLSPNCFGKQRDIKQQIVRDVIPEPESHQIVADIAGAEPVADLEGPYHEKAPITIRVPG